MTAGLIKHLNGFPKFLIFLLSLFFLGLPLAVGLGLKLSVESSLLCLSLLCFIIPFLKGGKISITFYRIDILLIVFIIYNLIHFTLFSKNSFFFIELWQRISVVVVFYLYRLLSAKYGITKIILLTFIFLRFILEVGLGSFQLLGILESLNPNYELTGSFTAPSFFGSYLTIGLTITFWFILNKFKSLTKAEILTAVLILLFGLGLLIASGSRSSWVCLCFAIFILLIKQSYVQNQFLKTSKLLKISICALSIIFCFIAANYIFNLEKGSVNGRWFTAKIISEEILKKPLLGNGLFSFSEGYSLAKVKYFSTGQRDWNEVKNADYLFGALNDYLEVTYEIGIIGMLFLCLIVYLLFPKAKNAYGILALSLLSIVVIFALFNTLLSNQSLLVIIAFIGFLCFESSNKKNPIIINERILKVLFSVIGLAFLLYSSSRLFARVSIKNYGVKNLDRNELENITKILASDGTSQFYFGRILYKKFDKKEGLKQMEEAVYKNYKPKNVKKLAGYYIKEKNFKRAEELFILNKFNEPYRYEARMDLIQLYEKIDQDKKLCGEALQVINLPIKIPSKKVDEYKQIAKSILKNSGCP